MHYTIETNINTNTQLFLYPQGLTVIQGAKMAGASKIIAIDLNPDKFETPRSLVRRIASTQELLRDRSRNTLLES
jgi:Zn-dependent alcohol dehydrogenase